jgi:hypothetical protein
MTWKKILKVKWKDKHNESFSEVIEVRRLLDFVKNDMSRALGVEHLDYDKKRITKEIASDILYLLGKGKFDGIDSRNETYLDLYIDDGFVLSISNANKTIFNYSVQHKLYKRIREGKITAEKVESIINKFLQMIGRTDVEHGLTANHLHISRYSRKYEDYDGDWQKNIQR